MMRKPTVGLWLVLLFLVARGLLAQGPVITTGASNPKTSNGAPTGACGPQDTDVDTTTGNWYTCKNGAWNLVSGGSGGGLADPGGNGVIKRTALNVTAPALAADIVGLFSTCSGTQYLGADGVCHNAAAGGPPTFTNLGTITTPPTYTCSGTGPQFFKATLGASINSSTLSGCTAGQQLTFMFVEDATGGRNNALPANFPGANPSNGLLSTLANSATVISFSFDGSNAQQSGIATAVVGCRSINGIVYASQCAGADLGAQVMNADAAANGTGYVIADFPFSGGTISTAISLNAGHMVQWFPGNFTQCGNGTITLFSGARMLGSFGNPSGVAGTNFTACNGFNKDMVSVGSSPGYQHWWELAWFTLHGNSANQTSGRGLVVYGMGETASMHNVIVQDTKGDACQFQGPGASSDNVTMNQCDSPSGIPWHFLNTNGNWHFGTNVVNVCPPAGPCVQVDTGSPGGMDLNVDSWKSDSVNPVGSAFHWMLVTGPNQLLMHVGMMTITCNNPFCLDAISYTTGGSYSPPMVKVDASDIFGTFNVYSDSGRTITFGQAVQGNGTQLGSFSLNMTDTFDRIAVFRGVKSISNGTNNNVWVTCCGGGAGYITLIGPTAAFTITGFGTNSPQQDGTMMEVVADTPSPAQMTLSNENTSSTIYNRIVTGTADVTQPPGPSAASFIYQRNDQTIAAAPTGAVENGAGTQAVITTTGSHGFQLNQVIALTGIGNACFNVPGGTAILAVTSTTLTVANTSCPANTTSGGGTAAYDRWRLKSTQPPAMRGNLTGGSCSSTGTGTSPACALAAGSTDSAGTIIVTTGTGSPAASGTVTLTFSGTFGTNLPVCNFIASQASAGQWSARVTFLDKTPSTASDAQAWDNNGSVLATSTAYSINYQCYAK